MSKEKKATAKEPETEKQYTSVEVGKIVDSILAATSSTKTKLVGKDKDNREITTIIEKSKDVRTIIVPEDMTLLQASKELKAMHENEEQVIDAVRIFEGWEWQDSLVAIKKVSEHMFGWINGKTIRTPWGEVRPEEIDVVVNVVNNDKMTEKCFYGKFGIAAFEDALADVGVNGAGNAYVTIKLKKKYSDKASLYFKAIEQYLRDFSIYRGKTVVITGARSKFGHHHSYEIMENKGADHIILNESEDMVIRDFVVSKLGETGKRVYLFTGPYGNGKTETAMNIGREGNKMGMPMFYLKDTSLFDVMLNQCKNYQPCILFVEDIDEIGSGAERDETMNKILNTIDGVQTKGNDITVIFTTNHEKKLNPALRRPGRIDQMINFTNPTKETRIKIMQNYFEGINGCGGLDFNMLADRVGDISASVVAQICKRAVTLSAKDNIITDDKVKSAATSMDYQIRLMAEPVEQEPLEKVFTDNLRNIIFSKEALKRIVDAVNG